MSVKTCLLNDLPSSTSLFFPPLLAAVTHISWVLPTGLRLLHHFHQLASSSLLISGRLVLSTETQINPPCLLSTINAFTPSDSDVSNEDTAVSSDVDVLVIPTLLMFPIMQTQNYD